MTSAAAESESDLPKLEKYELLGEIGHGGMATVYRGRDRRLGREVAVKIIHRHLRDNAEVATRFLAEARAAASLKHRGIVEVYDVSSTEDREKFLVAELIRGVTLRKLLVDDREMPAEIGAAIVLEVCDAIQHAHESGIVHRDVKPENVLVELPCHRVGGRAPVSGGSAATASGRRSGGGPRAVPPPGEEEAPEEVEATEADPPSPTATPTSRKKERVVVKITDFGIAKVLDAQGVTSTGQVLGSPAHMAPEQIEGGDIDARTDVFALGVLLYEAVVGHLPFEGKNPAQVLRRVLEGEYSPVDVERSDVGTRWSRVVKAAMALSPEDRTATPAALADAIRAELRGLGILEPHEEVVDYFDDPEGFRERHKERLVQRLLARGEKARKEHDVTGAAADFNRALALAPQDAEVQRRVLEMSRGRGRAALLRRGGAVLGGSLLLGLVAFFVVREIRSPHVPDPVAPAPEASVDPVAEDPADGLDPDLEEDGFEDPLPEGSSRPTKLVRKPAKIKLSFDATPRVVVFAVNPMGARLTVDGTAYEVTDRPRLVPGSHTAVVSPNDACCDESTVSFVVKPAESGKEADPQTVSLSAKFRPATVLLTGAPPGGQLVCGAFGLTLAAGGTGTVMLKRAQDTDVCDAISPEGTTRKTVTLKAGRSNAIPWPVQGGGG